MNLPELQNIIQRSLLEDIGFDDASGSLFSETQQAEGQFQMKSNGILAGTAVIHETYRQLHDQISVTRLKKDGEQVRKDEVIATVKGPISPVLSAERTILNFLQHLSGIATATKKAVEALGDPKTRICDTRKTLPGLRSLQKYAVTCGGGVNHRFRLESGIMIKDNHIQAAGSIADAIEKAKRIAGPMRRIEVETETRHQVLEAVEAGADIIMFDNRSPEEIADWISLIPEHVVTEASGGITLETIGNYRACGVDYISLGYLTHSVEALDISFNLK